MLDGSLDPKNKSLLQAHLQSCTSCQTQFDSLKSMKKSLASLPRVKSSDSFDVVLHAKLRQEMRYKSSRRWSFSLFEFRWKVPAYAVVAIFLMIIGAQLQRFVTAQSGGVQDNRIAIGDAVNGTVQYVEPGYIVVADRDSAKNTIRVVNYPDLDRTSTIEEYENIRKSRRQDYLNSNRQLPNLKEAPQSRTYVRQVNQVTQPNIKQAEFVF